MGYKDKMTNNEFPVFIQTAFPEQPDFDRWQQISKEEAQQAYGMTLKNDDVQTRILSVIDGIYEPSAYITELEGVPVIWYGKQGFSPFLNTGYTLLDENDPD